MDANKNVMQMHDTREQSLKVDLLSSLSELFENLRMHFESSGQSQGLQDILIDAMPHSLSICVENIISNELEKLVKTHVNEAGILSPQTWKIVAHNIFKTIKDSPQMYNVSEHIQNIIEQSLRTMALSDTLCFSTESLCHPRQIKQLAKDMYTERPTSTRKLELKMLLYTQLPHTTIILHECWSPIRQYMCNTLADENVEIFQLSLKIHAKFVSSSTLIVIKEGFLNLVQGFSLYYTQNPTQLPSYNGGFATDNNVNERLFRLGHLILFTIKKISINVVKSNEELEEILMSFFSLLSMGAKDEQIISPYVIIAALDPHAAWFTRLLHGLITRNIFFSIVSKSCLIQYIVKYVISLDTYNINKMSYNSMSHSVTMFCALVKFKSGQTLFPLTITTEHEPISLEYIYVQVVSYLNMNGNDELMARLLQDGISTPIIQASILKSDSPMMRALLEPLPTNVPCHVANVLEVIVQSPVGVGCLLGAHDAKTLIDYTGMALQNHVECSDEIKLALLRTCGKLFENHKGFVQLEYSPLVTKAIYQYEVLTSQSDSTIHQGLFRFLLSIGSTPLGLLSLSIHADLMECLLECCKAQDSDVMNHCLALANILRCNEVFPPQSLTRDSHAKPTSITSTAAAYENSEVNKFLLASRDSPHDGNWKWNLQKTYKASAHQHIMPHTLYELVDQLSLCKTAALAGQLLNNTTLPSSYRSQEVHWIIWYGEQHHLLQAGVPQYADRLVHVYSLFHSNPPEEGFDWFLAVSFLICAGNVERCCSFLSRVSSFPMAAIVWPAVCKHQSKRSMFAFGHKLELIIDEELPVATRVLKMGRVCWWATCRRWISQNFLNILEWEQICHWLALVFISQTEESCIYFCVALLKYMQPSIIMAYNNSKLVEHLNTPINGFRTNDFISFMNKLTKNYCNLKL